MRPARVAALVLVVVAVAWRDAPNAGFFWDDHVLVVENASLASFDWRTVLFKDLWFGTPSFVEAPSPYWRPLMSASLHLDRAFFGTDAWGPHVHNLAWHLAAVAALYGLALPRLGVTRAAAAAAIFGLHPIQSEAVLWVAARNDLMCAALLFLGLGAADRGRPILAATAVFFAATAKEVGFLAPIYGLLWGVAWGRPDRRGVVGMAIGVAAAFLLRAQADLGLGSPSGLDPLSLAGAPGKVIADTLGWLVWPWPLTSSWSLRSAPPSVWRWVTALVAAFGLLALWRAAPRRNGLLFTSALLAWAPTVVSVVVSFNIGERYLYLPLGFVAVAVASTVPATPPVRVGAALAGVAAFAVLSLRVPEWHSGLGLWQVAVARAPDAASYARLAQEYERNGESKEAFHAWVAATEYAPMVPSACESSLRLLVVRGAMVEAATLSDELAARGCQKWDFAGWRGVALLAVGRVADAREAMAGGPWRSDDEPILAAICEAEGDLDCVASWAVTYEGGPSELRDVAFDLVRSRLP